MLVCEIGGELGNGNLHWVKLCELVLDEDEDSDELAGAVAGAGKGDGVWSESGMGRVGGVVVVGLRTDWVQRRKKPQENEVLSFGWWWWVFMVGWWERKRKCRERKWDKCTIIASNGIVHPI